MNIGLDLDGTLLDSRARHCLALTQAADEYQVSLPKDFPARYFIEKCDGLSGNKVLEKHNVHSRRELTERWLELIESDSMLLHDVLYPGVEETLAHMVSLRFTLHLVTARQRPDAALKQISNLRLERYLTTITVVDPASVHGTRSNGKASQTRNLGIQAIIGDTEADQAWADALDARFLAVGWGFRSPVFWSHVGVKSFATLDHAFAALETIRPG